MNKSASPGITSFIATHRLKSCSMTWNAKSGGWLVIVSREEGVATCRGDALQGALAGAVAKLDAVARAP